MTTKIIILLGSPGAGKGTQGGIIAGILGVPHISTGDIFRKISKEDSKEAKMLKQIMSEGKLVPSELVNDIIKKFILSEEYSKGIILDGYPRTIDQAEFIDNNINVKVSVIYFDIADEVAIKRISGRYSCRDCGKSYNKYFSNSLVDGVCDACGSTNLHLRDDDNEEIILQRIEEYKKKTLPLVEYYKKNGNFFQIDAGNSIDKVKEDIALVVKNI
ncbi:MAG: adenylate kinase [Rickettsiaceae bacterium]|nr:adenylate kinase [Rickettsiaceae bacterium]